MPKRGSVRHFDTSTGHAVWGFFLPDDSGTDVFVPAYVPVDPDTYDTEAVSLTHRMLTFRPALGRRIWIDEQNLAFIFVAEAPVGSAETDAVFRGIKVAKNVMGKRLGKIEENIGPFAWVDRTTTNGWT